MNLWDKMAINLGVIGSLPVYLLFIFIFYAFMPGWFFLPFGLMVIFATIIISIIKPISRLSRPPKKGRRKPKFFWEYIDQYTFPSGHTTLATGLFTILILNMDLYANMLYVVVLSFIFLCAVAYSRVYTKQHYWRDIAGGLVAGILAGVAATLVSPLIAHWFSIGSFIVFTHAEPVI